MKQYPRVSVCMITYGQEKFIAEAINGVLMQECDFEVEFIIANDCSPDKTDEIIQKIIDNHPKSSWIKYIKHDENIGMMPNFIFAMQQCKGEYIALCEGDDYWTDPLKLQIQVDFLNKNPQYVIHSSCAEIVSDDESNGTVFGIKNGDIFFSLVDFYTQNNLITGSAIFKNIELDWPVFSKDIVFGDWFLYVMLLKETGLKVCITDDVFSVYRIHNGGVMGSLSLYKKLDVYMEQIHFIKQYIGYNKFSLRDIANINDYSITKFRVLIDEKLFSNGLETFLINFKYCNSKTSFRKYISTIKQSYFKIK
jgi:glycosyltransferase involved in cell wall biosynthesis